MTNLNLTDDLVTKNILWLEAQVEDSPYDIYIAPGVHLETFLLTRTHKEMLSYYLVYTDDESKSIYPTAVSGTITVKVAQTISILEFFSKYIFRDTASIRDPQDLFKILEAEENKKKMAAEHAYRQAMMERLTYGPEMLLQDSISKEIKQIEAEKKKAELIEQMYKLKG